MTVFAKRQKSRLKVALKKNNVSHILTRTPSESAILKQFIYIATLCLNVLATKQ